MNSVNIWRIGENQSAEKNKNMIAKESYFFDKNGEITTDESEAERILVRENVTIPPHFVTRYNFVEGKIDLKAKTPKANKVKTPTENKSVE